MQSDAFRDFQYPLNVFMLILLAEEREARYLHYGLFESAADTIGEAQQRSTDLLLAQLPVPPARILDVGIGLGTTLATLVRLGYDARGITPDVQQVDAAKLRWGPELPVHRVRFEEMDESEPYDAVVFQESAQYIEPGMIFGKAARVTHRVIVIDEFASRAFDQAGSLHLYDEFLEVAAAAEFSVSRNVDLSSKAWPTTAYFMKRIPIYRDRLRDELSLSETQIDQLLTSGDGYLAAYAAGDYTYRLLVFEREEPAAVR